MQNLTMWMLTFGDKVEVLEPVEVREKLMNMAESMIRKYGGKACSGRTYSGIRGSNGLSVQGRLEYPCHGEDHKGKIWRKVSCAKVYSDRVCTCRRQRGPTIPSGCCCVLRIRIFDGERDYMKYEWIDEYILKMPGVTKDLQKDWNWIRYQIGGKMFAAICLDDDDGGRFLAEAV